MSLVEAYSANLEEAGKRVAKMTAAVRRLFSEGKLSKKSGRVVAADKAAGNLWGQLLRARADAAHWKARLEQETLSSRHAQTSIPTPTRPASNT